MCAGPTSTSLQSLHLNLDGEPLVGTGREVPTCEMTLVSFFFYKTLNAAKGSQKKSIKDFETSWNESDV